MISEKVEKTDFHSRFFEQIESDKFGQKAQGRSSDDSAIFEVEIGKKSP